jgi:hypothetical protein
MRAAASTKKTRTTTTSATTPTAITTTANNDHDNDGNLVAFDINAALLVLSANCLNHMPWNSF